MSAVAFDLGDTLVEYAGLPPSWVEHYPDALRSLAAAVGFTPNPEQVESAAAVLRRYNTRIHAREHEVTFATILQEISGCFGRPFAGDELPHATAFFRVFRQRLRCFPDSPAALKKIRERGLKIGVFTDVPYGMPAALVAEDVAEAGLAGRFNVLITSREAGFRKPAVATLAALARALECGPSDMAYVGNERKDVEVALAFGCEAVLLDRARLAPAWGQHRTIISLAEL